MTERTYRLYQDKSSAPSIVTRRNPATGEEWQELVEAWAIYDRTKNVKRQSGHFFVVRKRLDGKLVKE